MAVITISRQFGAAGRTLGKSIAKKLKYDFYDEQFIQMIADKVKVSVSSVTSFERHERGTSLTKLFSGIVHPSFVERLLDEEKGYLTEKVYIESLTTVMKELASRGNVVLLGRGGQFILKKHYDAYHILLIARLDHRIQFMIENYMMDAKQARAIVMREDKRRANFYKRLGKQNYEDPRLYHLVINLSRVGLKKAEQMVLELVE